MSAHSAPCGGPTPPGAGWLILLGLVAWTFVITHAAGYLHYGQ